MRILEKNIPIWRAHLAYQVPAKLGEGAIWHPERNSLFWVDIMGNTLYEFFPEDHHCNKWTFDVPVSTVVPESDNAVVVALQNRIEYIDLRDDTRTVLVPLNDENGTIRTNDGKCDPAGRLWVGTIAYKGTPGVAKLYCLEPDGTLSVKLEDLSNSNGLVWTSDRQTMYYIDTPTQQISRFVYDAITGNIEFDGIAVTVPKELGSPDGMSIDENDQLWVAHYGGNGVYHWDPVSGELLGHVWVPCKAVTSCAFGGENLDTLYITTAGGVSREVTHDGKKIVCGSLFQCKPGVKGVPPAFFSKKN